MLKHLLKGLAAGAAFARIEKCQRLSTQLLRIEAAKLYLQGIRVARLSVAGALVLGLLLGLIGLGVLLVHAGLFYLLPWSLKTKALLGIALGVVYAAAAGCALWSVMAEKTWIEKSGMDGLLDEAQARARGI
jgi:hypothetical protein